MYEEENCMNRFCFLAIVLFVIIITTLYVMHVGGNFSTSSSDWGSWGAYFGGMISIVSVVLLYLSLYNQNKEHHSMVFNNIFFVQKNDLNNYNSEELNEMYEKIEENVTQNSDNNNPYYILPKQKSLEILSNLFYESIPPKKKCNKTIRTCKLIGYIIKDTVNDASLTDTEKHKYLFYLETALDEKLATVFLCYCSRYDLGLMSLLGKWKMFCSFDNDLACFNGIIKSALGYEQQTDNQ